MIDTSLISRDPRVVVSDLVRSYTGNGRLVLKIFRRRIRHWSKLRALGA